MAKNKKNQPSKAPPANPAPTIQVKPDVKADDVAMFEMEAAEVLGEMPLPIPSTEDTTLRELFDRTHGVLEKLKEAETRAKDAEQRANERAAQADAQRKEAEKQIEESAARPKRADKIVAEYQGYLEKLAEVLLPGKIEPDPIPGELVPSLAESHKTAAHEAVKKFKAAQKKAEDAAEKANTKEKEFDKRKGDLDTLEKNLKIQKLDLDKLEKDLLDRQAKIAERETNAENEFLAQRRTILGSIEAQIAQLREERDSLVKQIDEKRAADIAEWQQRCAEREQKWRDEDTTRTRKDDEYRDTLAKEIEAEREKKLTELRSELEAIRQREREKREAAWAAREQEIDARELTCREKEKELRKLKNHVDAEADVLEEDIAAQNEKVARLSAEKVAALEEDLAAVKAHLDTTIRARDQYYRDAAARDELERQLGGRSPQNLLDSLDVLKRESAELKTKLDMSLGEDAVQRLALLERELSTLREQRNVLQTKLVEAEQRLIAQRSAAVGTEGLKRANETLETTKKLLEQTHDAQTKLLEAKIKELRAEVGQYTQADDQRNPFKELVACDLEPVCQANPPTISPVDGAILSLKDFADDIRHRMASPKKDTPPLYYSPRDVRCFLAGLAMSKLMLLQGISGTGKTSLPLAFAQAVGAEAATVEVQAGWRDRQDLLGYYNAFHRHYYTTNFLQALYKAGTPGFKDRLFLVVLDEINLSRVEQFFTDFLSALELPLERRKITLLSDKVTDAPAALLEDGRHLPIPPNVWFVGTANHDETTTEFADKTYDRAHVMELPRNRDPFTASSKAPRAAISFNALTKLIREAQERQKGDADGAREWLNKGELSTLLDKRFRVGWGNRLERDVERFVPIVVEAGGTVGEAVDHLLYTKVFRKLRDRHDVRAKSLEDVRDVLKKTWPSSFKENPTRCDELLDREIRAKQREEEG